MVDTCLAVLHVAGLVRGHLARADALGNASPLVICAHTDAGHGRVLGMSAVGRRKVGAVRVRRLNMLLLLDGGGEMVLVRELLLLRVGTRLDAARAISST